MHNIEREFKWDATAGNAFEDFVKAIQMHSNQVDFVGAVDITDYYLDDKQHSLSNQKVALRIRHCGNLWQATLKSRSQLRKGLAVRQEFTVGLSPARSFRKALSILEKRSVWQGVLLAGLQERFRICNHRQIYQCVYQRCVCEAALDNYVTVFGGHRMRRKEIELELKKGNAKCFAQFVKKISLASNLKAAKISKVAGAEKWILEKISSN